MTALPKSPSQLEVPKKLSPKKAASAGPTISPVRKASAAITSGRQLAASQQRGMQQENQAHSLDSKGPQRPPEGIESGVRPALQESPTRSAAECCPVCIFPQYCLHPLCGSFSYIVTLYRSPNRALISSSQQQAKEPAWRDFIRTVQKQPVSAFPVATTPDSKHN